MLEFERRCANCKQIFITFRPTAKYCGLVCAGEGTQAKIKVPLTDLEYLKWREENQTAIEYLRKPWK